MTELPSRDEVAQRLAELLGRDLTPDDQVLVDNYLASAAHAAQMNGTATSRRKRRWARWWKRRKDRVLKLLGVAFVLALVGFSRQIMEASQSTDGHPPWIVVFFPVAITIFLLRYGPDEAWPLIYILFPGSCAALAWVLSDRGQFLWLAVSGICVVIAAYVVFAAAAVAKSTILIVNAVLGFVCGLVMAVLGAVLWIVR